MSELVAVTVVEAVKESRKYRKALASLTSDVRAFLIELDYEMKKPSTNERGKRIAALSNALEMANDKVRRFVLDESL